MKQKLFVVPLCLFFAFCSRKTVPPPPTGVSNVKVGRGDTMTSAASAGASYSNADRDWAYRSTRDTSLNGTWTLEGMVASDGSWSTTEVRDSVAGAVASTDTAMAVGSATTTTTTGGTTTKSTSTKKSRNKSRNTLYAGAQSRLKLNYKLGSHIDTTALEPYAYWKRTPSLVFNAGIFTGNTGCNSMSGRVNYDNKDLRFNPTINTSKMACNEYDENMFLTLLRKVDNYTMSGNTLELRQGNTRLLSFRKS